MSATSTRAPRSDARRNRERLLRAARAVIAKQGVGAPLEEIARSAALGIGTLYRHFPTRTDLFEALAAERLEALATEAESLRDTPRALDGLVTVLERVVSSQERDLALREALVESGRALQLGEARLRWRTATRALVERARTEGDLRQDVGYADVVVSLWGLARIVEATGDHAPGAWRRHLAIVLAGLGAGHAPIPGTPLTDAELDAGAHTLQDRRRRIARPAPSRERT